MSQNLDRARKLMSETDLTIGRLGALAAQFRYQGLSEASLSRALSGKPLSGDADRLLGVLVAKLESLVKDAAPLMISFSNVERVKQLVEDIESRRIVLVILSGLQPVQSEG